MIFQKIAKLLYCYIAGDKKNNLTIQQYNNRKSQKGFTLIELMIAIGVTAIIGTLGIAGFSNYNQVQALNTAGNDIATILNVARSRALSQVKLGLTCKTEVLEGYGVEISVDENTYSLKIYCPRPTNKEEIEKKILPQGVKFKTQDTTTSFFFPVLTGGVEASGQIVITNTGEDRIKTITVNSLGGVSIQ